MGLGDQIANAASGGQRVALERADCLAVDWVARTASLNIGGGVASIPWAGEAPVPGYAAWVLIVGQAAVCLGAIGLPAIGTIRFARDADGYQAVQGDDGVEYRLAGDADATFTSGARVLIDWARGGHIVARVSAEAGEGPDTPAPVVPAAPSADASAEKTRTFYPTDSASWYKGRWNTSDVIYGLSYPVGAWFYGRQIEDTIPDYADVLSVELLLVVGTSYGNGFASIGTHDQASRPAGPFPIDNLTNVGAVKSGFSGYVRLDGFGDQLKTGSAKGLGTKGPGFRQFKRGSGALRIRWKE